MVQHNDDSFATMLLMMQINPQREELVLPLSAVEWHQLHQKIIANKKFMNMGSLLRTDMSELTYELNCTEDEAYRICILLGRTLPLSIVFEQMLDSEIEIITYEQRVYPERLRDRLFDKAPPLLFMKGRPELFKQSAIAILGAQTPTPEMESHIRLLTRQAIAEGYTIVTDGRNGAGTVAADEAVSHGGHAMMIMAGGLREHSKRPDIEALIEDRRIALVSQFHPDAPYTPTHARQRNKSIYALCEAAFVFSCDEDKGTTWAGAMEALRSRYCKFIYVPDTDDCTGNRPLIKRGALKMPDPERNDVKALSKFWLSAAAEQTSLFDW